MISPWSSLSAPFRSPAWTLFSRRADSSSSLPFQLLGMYSGSCRRMRDRFPAKCSVEEKSLYRFRKAKIPSRTPWLVVAW